ncbi:hypothetical protein TraAM80_04891 [Trypanosoma rangeli]|nr:uncharacterized protein TraAM80_04891 [Trypanosoma rangeli]RNF04749.1 hypothetical protein TraAM80_04891 [Trypanosoma rangeli]|eukprot:RNF04749.1 hypothetical protein TraAM80_04891 [Trypanosoma rangeli]
MLMRNNTNWSAEACALLRLAPDELRRRGAWLPASSTAAVLEALALPPAPLQQPPVGEEGRWAPHAHDRPAEKTATAPLSAAPTAWEGDADELAVVEDVAGAP